MEKNSNSYQFTKKAAQEISLNSIPLDFDIPLCLSGENWGDQTIASYDDWEKEIPADEEKAKKTGWYDFYISTPENPEYDQSWSEYRDELLDELIDVEIIEEEIEEE